MASPRRSRRSSAEASAGRSSKRIFIEFDTAIGIYLVLCVFRILNALFIQTYFDPDEFWQTLEPAYCEALHDTPPCPTYTWEWTRRSRNPGANFLQTSLEGPARSYISILPTFLFYKLVSHWEIDTTWVVSKGPMLLHAVLVAAPTDLAVWYMAHWLKEGPPRYNLPGWCLLCSVTSWFHAYTMVRTFSNGLETMLLAVSLALVSPELLGGVQQAPRAFHRSALVFYLGGLSVGIRFTSLMAWIPMGVMLALQQSHVHKVLLYLFRTCALFGTLGILTCLGLDRWFFGFWTLPFLGNFQFNILLDRASLYGSHSVHWYVTAAWPALTGVLLPLLVWDWFDVVRHGDSNAWGRVHLWNILIVYLGTHSIQAHKEFRYILPILPIACVLAGRHLRSCVLYLSGRKRSRVTAWVLLLLLVNLVAVLYLGIFHQSAPMKVNPFIVQQVTTTPKKQRQVRIHYLLPCHATPVQSYLHIPGRSFDTWTLDCSPDCRANPEEYGECESFRFSRDPVRFVQEAYSPLPPSGEEPATCGVGCRELPDFVVLFAGDAHLVKSLLEDLQLQELARFPHRINGLRMGERLTLGSDYDNPTYRHVGFRNWLEWSLDEMIVFGKTTTQPL